MVGSDFTAVPWIHATGRLLASAAFFDPITIAAAPSEDGQVSA